MHRLSVQVNFLLHQRLLPHLKVGGGGRENGPGTLRRGPCASGMVTQGKIVLQIKPISTEAEMWNKEKIELDFGLNQPKS